MAGEAEYRATEAVAITAAAAAIWNFFIVVLLEQQRGQKLQPPLCKERGREALPGGFGRATAVPVTPI
ncbi:MAG: hypothetical protein B7X78_09015 [Sphingomonadales bacterium 39-62-4]|nr:MAG: hypothetical protein B7X78_09015 [Sphingomonadales bacterium 39-62-4]